MQWDWQNQADHEQRRDQKKIHQLVRWKQPVVAVFSIVEMGSTLLSGFVEWPFSIAVGVFNTVSYVSRGGWVVLC